MYDEIIFLISRSKSGNQDKYGDDIEKIKKEPVFAEKKSVKRSEFYQAQTSGYKPEIVFELADSIDYDDQQEVEYKQTTYKVLRTYEKGTALEIVCYGGVGNANTAERDKDQ